jgi:thioredoxin
MKKFFSLIIIAAALVLGCNSQTTHKQTTSSVEKELTSDLVKPTLLTKQMFLDQIMDYESNPNEWIYKGDMPGLIDFYADWCRPCRITSPILEELAQEYAGKIIVYKVDVQAEQELAAVFGIQSIPSFLYIPKDDTPVMSSGIAQTPEATKEMFRKQIDEILLNKTN